MKEGCPYGALQESSIWKQAVAVLDPRSFAPLPERPFTIPRTARIATAGSCFAQHIARFLPRWGRTTLVTEPGPCDWALAERRRHGYGLFPARFGNLYSALQLLQLFQRAYGSFTPEEPAWKEAGGWVDPFRPSVQPTPFPSLEALEADRAIHFAAVREMFESLDVFIFTLGLTEAWVSSADGAVFPVCPGCTAGVFVPGNYTFVNFRVAEVVEHLRRFLEGLAAVNPSARTILTVSPVPLVATMAGRHVLSSTVCSKSILRAAADEVCQSHLQADYFPSYEIITGTFRNADYFAQDRRSITEEGIGHVMEVFAASYLEVPWAGAGQPWTGPAEAATPVPVLCDEERAYDSELADLEVVTREDVEFYCEGMVHTFLPPAKAAYGQLLRSTWNQRAVLYESAEDWFQALVGAARAHPLHLCLGASQTMRYTNWPYYFSEEMGPTRATRPAVLNLGIHGTTTVEYLWTLKALLRLLQARDAPLPELTAVLLGCTDVLFRAERLHGHVIGANPCPVSSRERAFLEHLGRPELALTPGTLSRQDLTVKAPEDPQADLPLVRLPEPWERNILQRIEVAVDGLEKAIQAAGMKALLALQPTTTRANPSDYLPTAEREFQARSEPELTRLAWRQARGIARHTGEYTPIVAPDPPLPALDFDRMLGALKSLWQARAGSRPSAAYLDLIDLRAQAEGQALFHWDGLHYSGTGSRVIGGAIAATAKALLLSPPGPGGSGCPGPEA